MLVTKETAKYGIGILWQNMTFRNVVIRYEDMKNALIPLTFIGSDEKLKMRFVKILDVKSKGKGWHTFDDYAIRIMEEYEALGIGELVSCQDEPLWASYCNVPLNNLLIALRKQSWENSTGTPGRQFKRVCIRNIPGCVQMLKDDIELPNIPKIVEV